MENSYEALYTGVYIFVFVAALTIALYLFQGINELADTAYDYGKSVTSGGVIETDAKVEKHLTKTDVIEYYCNYIKKDNNETFSFTLDIDGVSNVNLNYKDLINDNYLDDNGEYILNQNGENSFQIKKVN